MAKKLKLAGYQAHYVGKWDIGFATPEHTPLGRGFDSFLGFFQAGTNVWEERATAIVPQFDICLSKFQDFSLHNATYRNGVTDEIRAELGCHMNFPTGSPITTTGCLKEDPQRCLEDSCFLDAMLLQHTLKLIQNHDADTPLFLAFSPHMVHTPLGLPKTTLEELDKLVAGAGVERKLRWTQLRRLMSGSILYMDKLMGKLVDALKMRRMYDNTLILYLNDNGGGTSIEEAAKNYPLKSGKSSDWEGAVRTKPSCLVASFHPKHVAKPFMELFTPQTGTSLFPALWV